ncbi:MAG: LVIVD repeat-containing protein [Gemmatimonadaceae bacterium]
MSLRSSQLASRIASLALLASLPSLGACGGDGGTPPPRGGGAALSVVGQGKATDRYNAELSVRGDYAYTTTWGANTDRAVGNQLNVWNVAGSTPSLVRSITVADATTLGDVQVSDDGRLLVVATERTGGSIVVFDLADPASPRQLSRFTSANTTNGVHTAEVQRVNGTLYAFLSVDPLGTSSPSRLTVVDLSDPSNPREVLSRVMGNPFVHDVFVRDGILFTALWSDGLTIWDVGGAGRGGTPANPIQLGNVHTVGGDVHNVWWFHDPVTGSKRYAFVGEEGPASLFSRASGDVHVVDVSDLANPREVAFYHVEGAGTHNFSMDEERGILYAAFYNAGVRALDARGDLASCTAGQKDANGRCDLARMGRELASGLTDRGPVFVWGVQREGSFVYASDMLNGIWKLNGASR